jgi:hypothetical protein
MYLKLLTITPISLVVFLFPIILVGQPYKAVPVVVDIPDDQYIMEETNRLIRTIEKYIVKIADKNGDYDEKTVKINDLLLNFTDDAKIQVSSIRTGKQVKFEPVPAGDYFRALRSLFYTQVQITFFEIDRAIEVIRISDSKFLVKGKFKQKFEGLDPYGNKIYGDITIKELSIEVTNITFGDGTPGFDFKVKSIMVENTFKDEDEIITPFHD